jgi:DinB superfamily
MTYAEILLPEFDQEMANTRKVLERIPDDRLDWRPHPKSQTIGWNANHVADLASCPERPAGRGLGLPPES